MNRNAVSTSDESDSAPEVILGHCGLCLCGLCGLCHCGLCHGGRCHCGLTVPAAGCVTAGCVSGGLCQRPAVSLCQRLADLAWRRSVAPLAFSASEVMQCFKAGVVFFVHQSEGFQATSWTIALHPQTHRWHAKSFDG